MSLGGRRLGICVVLAAGFLAIPAGSALAASAGALDPTFGGSGFVTTPVGPGTGEDFGNAMAIQSDGKIVAVGGADMGATGMDFAVARYNPDGTLDSTFGGGDGIVTTPIGAGAVRDSAFAVAIQSDGKIVVAGSTGAPNDTAVVRYTETGTLDQGFDGNSGNGNGIVVIKVAPTFDDAAFAVGLSSTKIVLGGYARTNETSGGGFGNTDFALVRLNQTDGTLDTSFDGDGTAGNGIVLTDVVPGGLDSEIEALKVLSDGKIVVAGIANTDTSVPGTSFNYDFALARYNSADGTLDTTFDGNSSGNGKFTTAIGTGEDFADALAIQGDGKIVVAGNAETAANETDFAVARYSGTDGSLDTSFTGGGGIGGNGKFTLTVSSLSERALAVAIDGSGRIVLAGRASFAGSGSDVALARLAGADGSPDNSFGNAGMVTTAISPGTGFDSATGLAIDGDGKIVVVGDAETSSSGPDFMVARYLSEPAPMLSFDADVSLVEGNSGTTNAIFHVSLDETLPNPVTVHYATADGTATSPADYASQAGTLTYSPGDTDKTITVPVNGDTTFEANETFTVNLSNASGEGALINGAQATGTIQNDDKEPTPPAPGVTPPATTPPGDTAPPNTKIGKGPKKKTTKRKARFTFSSTEAGSSFLCKLDKKPFAPCRSPKQVKVKPGKHVFKVAAVDAAGNRDPSPAKYSWKVLKP
jgi:uncharacterized delta-60 repeat protein